MGVKAKEDKDGAWVKLTDAEVEGKSQVELEKAAGTKVGGAYYRARTSSDATGTFYTLSVDKEEPKSENFYLVVRTPAGSAGVNGYTATAVDTSLNEHINYLLRGKKAADDKAAEDGHQNTASTYSVTSNYTHGLIDDNEGGIKQMQLHDVTYPLTMKVSDTVKFDPNQQYTSSDALYYQLDSSLVNCGKNGSAAGAHGYPTGTQGTYSFYVTVGGKYYAPHASTVNGKTKWTWGEATAEDHCAATGVWTADGTDMKLTLADAGLGAIDLSGIREIAKNHGSEFTITMKASLTMTEPRARPVLSLRRMAAQIGTQSPTIVRTSLRMTKRSAPVATRHTSTAKLDTTAWTWAPRLLRSRLQRSRSWVSTSMTSSPPTAKSLWWERMICPSSRVPRQ